MALSAVAHPLPRPLQNSLRRWCYPALLTARRYRVPVTRVEGDTQNGVASILVAGEEPWTFDLPRRFFGSSFRATELRSCPVWRLHAALGDLAHTADFVVARVGKVAGRLFFPPVYLRVPEWVDTILPVPADLNALVRSNHSLREDMRVVRHNGLDAAVSLGEEDFSSFYTEMYLPFIHSRHGALAHPTSESWLRSCVRRGGLIWVRHCGERVAGILFERSGGSLHLWAEGTRDGDASLVKRGVITALFFHAIKYAAESGCAVVEFGGTRAILSDGVLRYKRRWGMSVRVKPANQFYYLVRWAKWNASTAALLADLPLIHQNGTRLTVVTAAGDAPGGSQSGLAGICRRVAMPGIERIRIINAAGRPEAAAAPSAAVLVAGSPSAAELAAAS